MVSATHRLEAMIPLASPATSSTSPGRPTSSFAQELATRVEYQFKTEAHDIKASEVPGQTSGGSQFLANAVKAASPIAVTPISSGPNATATPASTSTTTPASDIPTMLGMGPVPGTAPVQQVTSPQPAPVAPEETEADAYWNAQPPAVQVLRDMPDGEAKDRLALNLANQGYSIDTQIMVWGWDPQMTMTVRANQGYSWVPSYGQANIPVGPGLSMPDDPTTYSPGNPPAGAIQVSTAFAVGTIQNPLIQTNSAST
jgi:hypothetical protein